MGSVNGQAAFDGLREPNGNGNGNGAFFDELLAHPPEWLREKREQRDPTIVACTECGAQVEPTKEIEQLHRVLTELQIENGSLKDENARLHVRVKALLRETDQTTRRKRKPEYEAALRVLDHWSEVCMPNAREKHSDKRVRAVMARLTASPNPFTEEELKRAADGYAAFPFVVNYRRLETGSPAQRKVDADLVYREARYVQQGLQLADEAEHRACPLPTVAAGAAAAAATTTVAAPAPAPTPAPAVQLSPLGAAAVAWAEHGFHVFPTLPRSKQPIAGSKGLLDATQDPERITRFWLQCPDHNVAVRCGVESCLVVLDVDDRNGGLDSLKDLEREFGELPRTGTVVTPGGGTHYYFRHPEHGEIRNSAGALGPGLDIRGAGGYVLCPPSIGPSGKAYEIDEGVRREPMPDWLIRKLVEHQQARASMATDWARWVHDGVSKGARNDQLLRFAGHLWSKGHAPGEVLEIVLAVNKAQCSPPLPQRECKKLVESVAKMRAREALQDLK